MAIEQTHMTESLAYVFGAEWLHLSAADQELIVRDCTEDGGVDDLVEYRQNIGAGNLQAYADCMRVRFTREDARKAANENRLIALGFDKGSRGCSQCAALSINGTPAHETGCPNQTFECKGCNARVSRRDAYCEECR